MYFHTLVPSRGSHTGLVPSTGMECCTRDAERGPAARSLQTHVVVLTASGFLHSSWWRCDKLHPRAGNVLLKQVDG